MYKKRYCSTPGIDVAVCVSNGGSVGKLLKFYVKVFYVVGKTLSGELSCTCTSLVNRIVSHNYDPDEYI